VEVTKQSLFTFTNTRQPLENFYYFLNFFLSKQRNCKGKSKIACIGAMLVTWFLISAFSLTSP
jgi:hypothetical protein